MDRSRCSSGWMMEQCRRRELFEKSSDGDGATSVFFRWRALRLSFFFFFSTSPLLLTTNLPLSLSLSPSLPLSQKQQQQQQNQQQQVIMQAQREYPPGGLAECRDKFLVQSVRLSPTDAASAKEATPEMFDASKARDIRQTKLRVVLSGPPKPPSPVPEGNEGDDGHAGAAGAFAAAGTGGAAAQGLDALARERDRLRVALARAERDWAGAQARLDAVAGGGGKLASKRGGGGGFSVVVLVLVALLAFAAGHFLAKGGLPALKK